MVFILRSIFAIAVLSLVSFRSESFAEEQKSSSSQVAPWAGETRKDEFAWALEFTDFGALNADIGIFSPVVFKALRFGVLGGLTGFIKREENGSLSNTDKPDLKIVMKAGGSITDFIQATSFFGLGQQWLPNQKFLRYMEIGFDQGIVSNDSFVNIGLAWRSHFMRNSKVLEESGTVLRTDLLVPRLTFGRFF